MKRLLSVFFVLPFLLNIVQPLKAQTLPFSFENYSIRQGLPSSTVYDILKDRFGFIWLATEDGVTRFDGSGFEVYRHNPAFANSLRVNYITALHESRDGRIWIGTNGGGLAYYDREKDSVNTYMAPISAAVTSIGSDSVGNVWVMAYGGVVIIDPPSKKIITPKEYQPLLHSLEGKICETFLQDAQKRIWIGTHTGLYQYDPVSRKISFFRHQENDLNSLPDNAVLKLKQGHNGKIWIATANGLALYRRGANGFTNYQHTGTTPHLSSNMVYALDTDNKNRLWIGTEEGLDVLDMNSNTITSLTPDIRMPRSISSRSIRSVLIDKQGLYWVGTFRGGLNKYDENINYFSLKEFNAFDPYGLRSNIVTAFAAGQQQEVFVGTDGGGLQLFHRNTGLLDQIALPITFNNNNQHDLTILTLEKDRKGQLWAGTFLNGLYCLNPSGGLLQHYMKGSGPNDLNHNDIFCLKEDRKGNIWVGTNGGGVNVIRADGSRIEKYWQDPSKPFSDNQPGNNFIRAIVEDPAGNIWVGTLGAGLAVFNPATETFTIYNKNNSNLPSDYVISMHSDHSGNLWVGTNGNGLGLLKPGSRQFTQIDEQNGLKNGFINAIAEDNAGKIWMSTNAGLYSLIPASGELKNYTTHNGLQSGAFVQGASLKLPDGELFFGGDNGFNYFNPAQLKINHSIPPVVFTNLKIDNQPVAPGLDAPIQKAILLADKIDLRYKQSFLIGFEALNFTASEANQYKYQLVGVDKNWIEAGKEHSAYYTNLDPGEYTFQVVASNNDGIWNEKGATIKVYVHPPFWRTTYAYIFYVLLLVGGVLYLRHRGIRRLKRQFAAEQQAAQAEQERKERENVHELDQQKIKFLTNLSHEFRTPISLILGPVDNLITQGSNERQSGQLQLIKRNGKRLLNLVNQLLDFRKMEEHELKLQQTEGELVSCVKESSDAFKDLAEKKKINFEFVSTIEQLHTSFDHDKLERIIFNLLSNAFKFTLKDGSISLKLEKNERRTNGPYTWVCLVVKDTGIGIPAEQKEKVFERFFQHTTTGAVLNQGTGIGLSITKEFVELQGGTIDVTSEPGKGTTFTVQLPFTPLAPPALPAPLPPAEMVEEPAETFSEPVSQPAEVQATDRATILLVEDDEDFRFYLKDNLRQQYQVLEAANGKEGWQKALARHPQLIVSDVNMPQMDGIELCRKIKSDKRTAHIPVILLTALTAEQDQLRGLETGANDYITKPFNSALLNAKVKNLLVLNTTLKTTYTKQIKVLTPEVKVESEDEKLMERIMVYLEENLTNSQLSVEELSRQIGMSQSSLYTKLLELSGETPIEFIRSVKLGKAAALLEKSDMTIAQIAYTVGFATPNYFSKSFKSKYGMLPSEYVQQKKGEKGSDTGTSNEDR